MPELPEVETVRGGLEKLTSMQPIIKRVRLMRPDLRFSIPKNLPTRLEGQPITGVRRRAKYLLIDTPRVTLLSHLGMTGSWRVLESDESHQRDEMGKGISAADSLPKDKHDHCYIELSDGRTLAFRDPRRFGMLDLIEPGQEAKHPRLKGLGPEPLDAQVFSAEMLHRVSRSRRLAVKLFIMDQKIVVGVGNIYASEALFRARIRPGKAANRLSLADCSRLVAAIREVLSEAIGAGGSSIRDYRQSSGAEGSFQSAHRVYDRAGRPCWVCGTPIRAKVMGGRSTYWCPKCQK
jgi:formamidopyrimidine-DNA glycosylase